MLKVLTSKVKKLFFGMPSWLTIECERYSDFLIIYSNYKYDSFVIYFYVLIDILDYISDLSIW